MQILASKTVHFVNAETQTDAQLMLDYFNKHYRSGPNQGLPLQEFNQPNKDVPMARANNRDAVD